MTEELDTHSKLVQACQEYLAHSNRFENKGADEDGVRARNSLKKLVELCNVRKKEIQKTRHERRKLRNGKNGRPAVVTKEKY